MLEEFPEILAVKDLQIILGMSKEFIYKNIKNKVIPTHQYGSKNYYFIKSEIIDYLCNNPK